MCNEMITFPSCRRPIAALLIFLIIQIFEYNMQISLKKPIMCVSMGGGGGGVIHKSYIDYENKQTTKQRLILYLMLDYS